MTIGIHYLTNDPEWFPSVELALSDPPGLLAIGGDLSPKRLYSAYQHGIFPWFNHDEPILWWSPDPRAVLKPSAIRCNKSLRKFLRKSNYRISVNSGFDRVIQACAEPRGDREGTWILPQMQKSYSLLHHQNKAHSIEVWQEENLVGGLYGVLVGSCFCGESMFSRLPNASKLALLTLGHIMAQDEHSLIDCQLPNAYLSSMGATLQSRDVFLHNLRKASQRIMPKASFSPKFIEWQSALNLNDNG